MIGIKIVGLKDERTKFEKHFLFPEIPREGEIINYDGLDFVVKSVYHKLTEFADKLKPSYGPTQVVSIHIEVYRIK